MGLFDRFKKEKAGGKDTPSLPLGADTAGKLLFLRERLEGQERRARRATQFRQLQEAEIQKLKEIALSLASEEPLRSFLVRLEGVEFWCAHMALPLPPKEGDLPALLARSSFFSQEELEGAAGHRSFLLVVQKEGGRTLEQKRKICCLFTRLCGALLELEGAVAFLNSGVPLLVGRTFFLHHAAILEQNLEDPEYFPAPLWIALSQANNHGHTAIGTDGLSAFGFPELFFLNPREEWPQVYQKLWLMSIFQITGKAVYREGDTIAFDPDKPPAVVKRLQERLAIIGG